MVRRAAPRPATRRALAQFFGGVKHGQDYESVTVNWNQASAAIVDGTADAAVLTVHFPGPRETRNYCRRRDDTCGPCRRHKFESDACAEASEQAGIRFPTWHLCPSFSPMMGSNWTVASEDGTFRGMAVTGGDFVNKSHGRGAGLSADQGAHRECR